MTVSGDAGTLGDVRLVGVTSRAPRSVASRVSSPCARGCARSADTRADGLRQLRAGRERDGARLLGASVGAWISMLDMHCCSTLKKVVGAQRGSVLNFGELLEWGNYGDIVQ